MIKLTEPMLGGVVFDLDGVIVDSHPIHRQAWRSFLSDVGKEATEADLDFILEGRKRKEILVHFLGNLSETEIQTYGDRKDELFRQASTNIKPICGSVEFIKNARKAKLRVAVATSASRRRALWTLEQLGLGECFQVVVSGDDVTLGKPDPTIYRMAAQRLSISPDSLLAVEDSVSGVQSAIAAGLRCIALASAENASPLTRAGAAKVVPTLMGVSLDDLSGMFSSSPCVVVSPSATDQCRR